MLNNSLWKQDTLRPWSLSSRSLNKTEIVQGCISCPQLCLKQMVQLGILTVLVFNHLGSFQNCSLPALKYLILHRFHLQELIQRSLQLCSLHYMLQFFPLFTVHLLYTNRAETGTAEKETCIMTYISQLHFIFKNLI